MEESIKKVENTLTCPDCQVKWICLFNPIKIEYDFFHFHGIFTKNVFNIQKSGLDLRGFFIHIRDDHNTTARIVSNCFRKHKKVIGSRLWMRQYKSARQKCTFQAKIRLYCDCGISFDAQYEALTHSYKVRPKWVKRAQFLNSLFSLFPVPRK